MSNRSRARAARWLAGAGIEIGALNAPLTVPEGVEVQYVDRAPIEHLRDHYQELRDAPLVSPSIIGDAQDLSALADGSTDFVVANHLIEHLEDPIRGLKEMVRVVRPGGVLFMAIPDPRATFDADRALTSVEHLVSEFRLGTQDTRRAHYEDWVAKAEPRADGKKASVGQRVERVRQLMDMDYSIHFHLWRPDTFLEFILAAASEAGLELELLDFQPRLAGDNEYIFVFRKGDMGAAGVAAPSGLDPDASASQVELAAVIGSRSWRMTRPLRAAAHALRRLRRRVTSKKGH